jgi:hypothetical protein
MNVEYSPHSFILLLAEERLSVLSLPRTRTCLLKKPSRRLALGDGFSVPLGFCSAVGGMATDERISHLY